mmetsp:Transcript_27582/g.62507  ORF Transcript_27582/g.62507 Transcript_27582/m.62507 type:complete len:212 (-) Transcript_27582:248-883(-)
MIIMFGQEKGERGKAHTLFLVVLGPSLLLSLLLWWRLISSQEKNQKEKQEGKGNASNDKNAPAALRVRPPQRQLLAQLARALGEVLLDLRNNLLCKLFSLREEGWVSWHWLSTILFRVVISTLDEFQQGFLGAGPLVGVHLPLAEKFQRWEAPNPKALQKFSVLGTVYFCNNHIGSLNLHCKFFPHWSEPFAVPTPWCIELYKPISSGRTS